MEGTATQAKRPSPLVTCDICHREFSLTKGCLTENKVTLEKRGLEPKEVVLTTLKCPCCGKEYPVVMDDENTLSMLQDLKELYAKSMKYRSKNKEIPERLRNKQQRLTQKLGFNRRKLAEKYNKSYYQLEDGSRTQLDYCYREHMHG